MYGIVGKIIMNIQHINNKEAILGIFHFTSLSIAGGNVVVFESSIENSNNAIIKLNDNTITDKDKQVYFKVKANVFGDTKKIQIHLIDVK